MSFQISTESTPISALLALHIMMVEAPKQILSVRTLQAVEHVLVCCCCFLALFFSEGSLLIATVPEGTHAFGTAKQRRRFALSNVCTGTL